MSDLMERGTRCTARRKNGEPCTNWAIKGANVCRMHGGGAPQVKRAAMVRLLQASDSLMASLLKIAKDESVPVAVRLTAIRDGLDRAGLNARAEVDVDVKVSVWDQNAAEIIQVISETVKESDRDQAQIVDAEVVEAEDWQADDRPTRRGQPYLPSERKKAAPVSMTPPSGPRPSRPDYDAPAATALPNPPKRTAQQRKGDATADAANKAVEARDARETRTLRRRKPKPR